MQATPVSRGIIAGIVAASATAGALVAMGRRLGSAGLAFSAIANDVGGSSLMRVTAASVVGGIVLHVIVTVAWSIVFALLVERWRGRTIVAAIATSVAAFALSWMLARVTNRGLSVVLPIGDRVVLAVVFALALVVGIRFALPAREAI